MFRGKKKAVRILAGILAGMVIGGTTAAATNTPDKPCAETTATTAVQEMTNGKPVTEENVLELLHQIEKDWPHGTVWGLSSTPGTHKNEVPSTEAQRILDTYPVNSTYACGGYAAMVSSLIFGDKDNPGRKLDDPAQMRPGDIVVLVNNTTNKVWHVMVALESPDEVNAFHYTDGNHNRAVHWPDPTTPYGKENLDCYRGENKDYRLEVWTRYPENVPYTGASVNGWPTGTMEEICT